MTICVKTICDSISGVIASVSVSSVSVSSVSVSSVVDRGFKPVRVKPKTIKLVFVASPLHRQH